MDILLSMKIFRKVVELNSFVGASEKLDISTAMTSKYIKNLEDHLGVRLLNRTSRRLSLTNEGKIYYDSCTEILNDLEEVESAIKCASVVPTGILKVAVPAWFNFNYFTEGITAYCKKYPEVLLEISLNDRLIDLVEEGIDVALRVTYEPNSNLIARRICNVNFFITGSEKYLETYGTPKSISDFEKHKFINSNHSKQRNSLFYIENEIIKQIDVKPAMITNNTTLILKSALSGLGLAFLPEYLVNECESIGSATKLKIVLPELKFPQHYLFAVYSSRRFLSPKVRTFIDFMVEWMGKNSMKNKSQSTGALLVLTPK